MVFFDFEVVGFYFEDYGYKIVNYMKVVKELEICGVDELVLSFDNYEEWDIEYKLVFD